MWWEEKGEKALKEIVASSTGVSDGMSRLISYCEQRAPDPIWASLRKFDYEHEAEVIRKWFINLLPMPDDIEVVWVAFWDVIEGFNLEGATDWSCDPDDWEWWGDSHHSLSYYESLILAEMWRLASEVDGDGYRPIEEASPGNLITMLLTIGYISLVFASIFRTTDRKLLLGGRSERWVVTGFPDAEYGMIVGSTDVDGFESFENMKDRKD